MWVTFFIFYLSFIFSFSFFHYLFIYLFEEQSHYLFYWSGQSESAQLISYYYVKILRNPLWSLLSSAARTAMLLFEYAQTCRTSQQACQLFILISLCPEPQRSLEDIICCLWPSTGARWTVRLLHSYLGWEEKGLSAPLSLWSSAAHSSFPRNKWDMLLIHVFPWDRTGILLLDLGCGRQSLIP